jgi:hypothetical protein
LQRCPPLFFPPRQPKKKRRRLQLMLEMFKA